MPHRRCGPSCALLAFALLLPAALHAQDRDAAWVRRAIETNAALAADADDLRGAADAVRAAGAARYPRLALELQGGAVRRQDPGGPGSIPARQAVLTLEQTLYDGQRARHDAAAAQARLDRQRVQRLAAVNDAAAEALQALHEWRAAEQGVAAQHEAEQALAALEQTVAQRLQAGMASALDLREAQRRWLAARTGVAQAASRRRAALLRLQSLTGMEPDDEDLAPGDPPAPLADATIEALRARCRRDCAGVREAAAALAAARAERDGARAETRPQVTLQASAAVQQNLQGSASDERSARVMLSGRWTLFDGGGLSARLAQREQAVLAAERRLEDSAREALLRFDLALGELDSATAQHALAVDEARAAADTLRLTRLGFDGGYKTTRELGDAATDAARARAAQADADARQRIAWARLLAFAGALADQFGVAPPAP